MAGHHDLLIERPANADTPLGYHVFLPPAAARRPPLVAVHGSGRGAVRLFRALLPTCISSGTPLIAPAFTREGFTGYQTLAGQDGPLAAQQTLNRLLEDVCPDLGLATGTVDLLGYSGGAQFAHRYAMAVPHNVRRLVVCSAGWYTSLEQTPYPRGSGASPASGGRPLDVEGFLSIPVHVLVGERDLDRDAQLRTGRGIDRRQGSNRLERALRWVDHLEDQARLRGLPARVSFDLLPDTGHSFTEAVHRGGLVRRAFDFLHPQPRSTGDNTSPDAARHR